MFVSGELFVIVLILCGIFFVLGYSHGFSDGAK